jgi:hypothetical protein
MSKTSQEYLLTVLLCSVAIVFVSLNFIWSGSF